MPGQLILSVGMPRAGSGWYYNLTHDLVVAGGYQDARAIRKRYFLQRLLTEVNCNIGSLGLHRIFPVMIPVWFGNTFTIKTHAGLEPFASSLIRQAMIRPTYIYRDPRAALLSAYEYGQQGLGKERENAFSHLANIDAAIQFMKAYVQIWHQWIACEQAWPVRYEDLLVDFPAQAENLIEFLQLNPHDSAIQEVVEKYKPQRAREIVHGTHFNQGEAERFRQVLTEEQLAACSLAFQDDLELMGYQP